MTRRRYTADQLVPVTQVMTPTFRRHGDPTSGTRRECWAATSTDGTWTFQRIEDTGTLWAAQHIPTGYPRMLPRWATLDDARADAHSGELARLLWEDAHWVLEHLREVPDPAVPAGLHDCARGLLTWLVEHDAVPDRVCAV